MNQDGSTQVGLEQISIPQNSTSQISVLQAGLPHVGFTQTGSTQISSTQVSISQIGLNQNGLNQAGTEQVSTSQVSTSQVSVVEVSPPQNNSLQVGIFQISPDRLTGTQVNPGKISFASSVASEQFFRFHSTSFTSIYDLNNTALTLWNTYLQPTTPLNLNIEITDLPTGQLAEATITGFDPTGRPNSGTLYLDTDANSLGWYIDPTPWDNTEYSQTLTDTAYRATLGSDAYGHYDLLTTILHETAHLQGFIAGYSNFDNRVQTQNGSKVFVGHTFSAILTPDGSHL